MTDCEHVQIKVLGFIAKLLNTGCTNEDVSCAFVILNNIDQFTTILVLLFQSLAELFLDVINEFATVHIQTLVSSETGFNHHNRGLFLWFGMPLHID